MFDVLHTVINSVFVQNLPTEQATSVATDFSRGYDPYTHACKARPPTIVGRPFLSVIIISWESMHDILRNINESLFLVERLRDWVRYRCKNN